MTPEKPPSHVLRERFAQEYVLPLARAIFELEARCQSVLVTVGQYWCDEATDAVHSELIACPERDPTWPLAGQARPGAIADSAALAETLEFDAEHRQADGPSGLAEVQYALLDNARQRAFGDQYFGVLDDNSDMIVAFASYCREVSDQEQPSWRSHTPYGLIRRPLGDDPLTLEVIGRMYRPQWEDRWDVLDEDGIITGLDEGAEESSAPSTNTESSANSQSSASTSKLPRPPPLENRPKVGGTGGLTPAARVLLFAVLILAIIAARACLKF